MLQMGHSTEWLRKCYCSQTEFWRSLWAWNGINAFKKTCNLLGINCLCSSLFSEPAVTRLLLSTGITGCRADGRRQSACKCALLQHVFGGEDGSSKCSLTVCSPVTWEQTDHMHGTVGIQAVLMAVNTHDKGKSALLTLSGSAPPGQQ